MRQARQRIAVRSVTARRSHTFMELIGNNPNAFRVCCCANVPALQRRFVPPSRGRFSILLRNLPTIWNSKPYAARVYCTRAEAMVTIVFGAGAEALTSALNSVGNCMAGIATSMIAKGRITGIAVSKRK